jgi:hypothetical protein
MMYRSLVHLDAEARMTAYEDQDGNKRTSLSLIQRTINQSKYYCDNSF